MGEDIKEIVGILIVLVLIISGVQWFFVRFTHWSVALVATGLIAFVISFFYVSLSHASPNGGSNGPNGSEFITPLLVVFSVLFCGFCLVCYLSKSQVPKTAFVLPLSLIALIMIGQFVCHYIEEAEYISYHYKSFIICQVEVKNESGSMRIAHKIIFRNTSDYSETYIQLESDTEELNNDEVLIYNQPNLRNIPRFANKITFECFLDKTNSMPLQEFPFDYSLCKEKDLPKSGLLDNLSFWIHEKGILPIKISFLPGNKVNLYIDNRLVKQYQLRGENKKKQN